MPFFLTGIAAHFDKFHTVEQRLRNHAGIVGSGNKQNVRQIERDFQIMVTEVCVLFRVEHFQHSGTGVALIIGAHLVDFVQQDKRVTGTGLTDCVDNPAGHRTKVGFTMTADFCFILNAAQRNTHIFAS